MSQAIHKLPTEVQSILRTGQNITCPTQCVIELFKHGRSLAVCMKKEQEQLSNFSGRKVLNALDAGATCIAVQIDLSIFRLQVVDNGSGISKEHLDLIATRYMTSKCHSLQDLQTNLCHYGYRGEALASIRYLCKTLRVITKPHGGDVTYVKVFRMDGEGTVCAKVSAINRLCRGTTVTVEELFHRVPVRKQSVRPAVEFEQIYSHVQAIALVHPKVSFTLRNDATGQVILNKKRYNDMISNFKAIFDIPASDSLIVIKASTGKFKMSGLISRKTDKSKKYQLVYVNGRIVYKTKLHDEMNRRLTQSFFLSGIRKPRQHHTTKAQFQQTSPDDCIMHAVFLLNIKCPFSEYDITFDPKKTLIEFNAWSSVLRCLKKVIDLFLQSESSFHKIKNTQNDTCLTKQDICLDLSKKEQEETYLNCVNDTFLDNPHVILGPAASRKQLQSESKPLQVDDTRNYQISDTDGMEFTPLTPIRRCWSENPLSLSLRKRNEHDHLPEKVVTDSDSLRLMKVHNSFETSTAQDEKPKQRMKTKSILPIVSNGCFQLNLMRIRNCFSRMAAGSIKQDMIKQARFAEYKCAIKPILYSQTIKTGGMSTKHGPWPSRRISNKSSHFNPIIYADTRKYKQSNKTNVAKYNKHSKFVQNHCNNFGLDKTSIIKLADPVLLPNKVPWNDMNIALNETSLHSKALVPANTTQFQTEKCSHDLDEFTINTVSNSKDSMLVRSKPFIINLFEKNQKKEPDAVSHSNNNFLQSLYLRSHPPLTPCTQPLKSWVSPQAFEFHYENPISKFCCCERVVEKKNENRRIVSFNDTDNHSADFRLSNTVQGASFRNSLFDDHPICPKPKINQTSQSLTDVFSDEEMIHSQNNDPSLLTPAKTFKWPELKIRLPLNIQHMTTIANRESKPSSSASSTKDIFHYDSSNNTNACQNVPNLTSTVTQETLVNEVQNGTQDDLLEKQCIKRRHCNQNGNSDSVVTLSNECNTIVECDSNDMRKNINKEINCFTYSIVTDFSFDGNRGPGLSQKPNELGVKRKLEIESNTSKQHRISCRTSNLSISPELQHTNSFLNNTQNNTDITSKDIYSTLAFRFHDAASVELNRIKKAVSMQINTRGECSIQQCTMSGDRISLGSYRKTPEINMYNENLITTQQVSIYGNVFSTPMDKPNYCAHEKIIEMDHEVPDTQCKDISRTGALGNLNTLEGWEKQSLDCGRIVYFHSKSGMSSYEAPQSSNSRYSFRGRVSFLPKGMSPEVLYDGKRTELSATEKEEVKHVLLAALSLPGDKRLSQTSVLAEFREPEVNDLSIRQLNKQATQVHNILQQCVFTKRIFTNIQVLRQVGQKFVAAVVQSGDNETELLIVMFDQHAADERIRLELLLKRYTDECGSLKCQALSRPIVIILSQAEARLVSSFSTDFARLGIHLSVASDSSSITVTTVPDCIMNRVSQSASSCRDNKLTELLESVIKEQVGRLQLTQSAGASMPLSIHSIIASEACRGAIKFGDPMTPTECEYLLDKLSYCNMPFQCAHARPSLIPIARLLEVPSISQPNLHNLKRSKNLKHHIGW